MWVFLVGKYSRRFHYNVGNLIRCNTWFRLCQLPPNFSKRCLSSSYSVVFLHLVLLASSRLCRLLFATSGMDIFHEVLVQPLTSLVPSWYILPSDTSRNICFGGLYNSVGKLLIIPRVEEYESYVRVQISNKARPVSFGEIPSGQLRCKNPGSCMLTTRKIGLCWLCRKFLTMWR